MRFGKWKKMRSQRSRPCIILKWTSRNMMAKPLCGSGQWEVRGFDIYLWAFGCYVTWEISWLTGKVLVFKNESTPWSTIVGYLRKDECLKKDQYVTHSFLKWNSTDSSYIHLEAWVNLEIMMVDGENTSSGWRKTYWSSPSITTCRKTRQREASWELRGSMNGSNGLWRETE